MGLPILIRRLQRLVVSNSPAILTGIGASGVLGTAVLAVKATPRALKRIEATEWKSIDGENSVENVYERLSNFERFKLTWSLYIPAGIVGVTSIAAIIGANSINSRRIAATLSVVSVLESGFKEYREKVVETLGDKKERALRSEISDKKVSEHDFSNTEVIVVGNGDVLCYDTLTDRSFLSTMEKIRKAVNDINQLCLLDMSASQNEFYRLIGLPPTRFGEELGWRFDRLIEVEFDSHLLPDGRTALSVNYAKPPISNFHKINR